MGGIGAGLLHPLITPAHLLLLLGLGLWLGQQRPVPLRWPTLLFVCFSGAGLVASNWLTLSPPWQPSVFLLALVSTLLAAWLSLGLCLVNAAFYTSMCPPRRWAQAAIRVLAAWAAAVCVLLLAFALRASLLM